VKGWERDTGEGRGDRDKKWIKEMEKQGEGLKYERKHSPFNFNGPSLLAACMFVKQWFVKSLLWFIH
jgi:hypothetical protein